VEAVLWAKEVGMDIGECGVCGQWASGTRLPSGNRRPDGTTPMDNFVCYRYQEEAHVFREVGAACDRQGRRRRAAYVSY